MSAAEVRPFGHTGEGEPVALYTLRNAGGMVVRITNFGGTVTELWTPDRHGRSANVTLGFASLAPYIDRSPYFGALIGRYANRIANGRFAIGNRLFELPRNNGAHHLHGGQRGFDKAVWRVAAASASTLVLRHVSPDGDQGYPGRLEAEAVYELAADNELRLTLSARSDQPTPVSLTSHAYFNLAGAGAATVLDHELRIAAAHFTPADAGLIPTGERRAVEGTAFDFRTARTIGSSIGEPDPQLAHAGGYDHNFVLEGGEGRLRPCAWLRHPDSGRTLELLTDAPGLQFYSGNFLDGGNGFAHRSGLCLEPQRFPDAPNQPGFGDVLLRPGADYTVRIAYRFGAADAGTDLPRPSASAVSLSSHR
ncbi:MAG: aldose epimerase family protein [Telluria sp.]